MVSGNVKEHTHLSQRFRSRSWAGLVSWVGASHRVNQLIVLSFLGQKCPRKLLCERACTVTVHTVSRRPSGLHNLASGQTRTWHAFDWIDSTNSGRYETKTGAGEDKFLLAIADDHLHHLNPSRPRLQVFTKCV